MKPDRISYKKIFSIGSFVNETIGMEAQLDEGDDLSACLFDLKNRVEAFHKINNPPVDNQYSDQFHTVIAPTEKIIQSIDPRAKDLKEIIEDCSSLEELEKLKDEAGRLGLMAAYNLKRETFKKSLQS